MIQPRRSAGHGRNDAQTPDPSFTAVQYERLALLYIIASVRAEHWLIPAFHAAIDGHIPNGHDDPLNFDIDSFATGLEWVMERIEFQWRRRWTSSQKTGLAEETFEQVNASAPIVDRLHCSEFRCAQGSRMSFSPRSLESHARGGGCWCRRY
jgi:hypothetical protein